MFFLGPRGGGRQGDRTHLLDFRPTSITGCAAWLDASYLDTIDTSTAAPDVDSWTDRTSNGLAFVQTTAAKKPHSGVATINARNAIVPDKTDDILRVAGTTGFAGTKGHLFVLGKSASAAGHGGYLLSSADEASANFFCSMTINTASGKPQMLIKAGGTTNIITATNAIPSNVITLIEYVSDGTAYEIIENGVSETLSVDGGSDNGNWFGDVGNRDSVTLFAGSFNSVEAGFSNFKMAEVIYFDGVDLTEAQRTLIRNYLSAKWSPDQF